MNCKYFQSHPRGFTKIIGSVHKFTYKGLNLIAHRNWIVNGSNYQSRAFVVTHVETGLRVCGNESDITVNRKQLVERAKEIIDKKTEKELQDSLEFMKEPLTNLIDRLIKSNEITKIPIPLLKELRPGYVSDYNKSME